MQSRLFILCAFLFVLIGFSMPVQAEQYKVIKVASWDSLNMRSGPGVKNGVVAKLPHNATAVRLVGGSQQVGRTHWVEVSWQGKRGWVSKAYLGRQVAVPVAGALSNQPAPAAPAAPARVPAAPAAQPRPAPPPTNHIVKKKQSGMWILECGNRSPYWKVEILPEWLRGTLGAHKTGMPITHKRQKHGKYRNVAVETEVRGQNRWNRLRMVLTYNKSCYSTLTNRKVSFSVEGTFNNDVISGCCHSYQVK